MQLQSFNISIKSGEEDLYNFLRKRKPETDGRLVFQDLIHPDFTIYRANVMFINYLKATCRHQASAENRLKVIISIAPAVRNILLSFTGVFIYMFANTIYFNWESEIFYQKIALLSSILAFVIIIWFLVTRQLVNRFSSDIESYFKMNDL